MRRDSRRSYDDQPGPTQTRNARVLVIVFIVFGIWLLRSMRTGEDTTSKGRSQDAVESAFESASGDPVQYTAGQDLAYSVLRRMLDTYKSLPAFREQTRIQVEIDKPDTGLVRETIDVQLAYETPNRLRFVVTRPGRQTAITCDGRELRARVIDSTYANFDGQFVKRPAPRQIDVTTVFAATEFADPSRPHELLSVLLELPVDITVSSLGMLTDRGALAEMFQQASAITRLADQQVGGVDCCVVRFTAPAGTYTVWIDQTTNLVHRIEHPVTRIVGSETRRGRANAARIVSEHEAALNPSFARQDFELPVLADAKLVRHFVLPPQDQDIGILNTEVPPFSFTDKQGNVLASDRWSGKHALLIWFSDHPTCQQFLTSLAPLFERYRDEDRIFFCAVSTDPPTTMGHQDVRNLQARWGITIPVVRDLNAVGRDIFQVRQAPTLIVTSPDESGSSRIQLVEVGSFPDMTKQLTVVMDQLLSGQNIVDNYVRFVERRQREYKRYLATASVDAPTAAIEGMHPTEIGPETEFSSLMLTPLWELDDLGRPGNITIDHSNDRPELLVHDGWHDLVRINAEGDVLARHSLMANTEVSRLRALTTQRRESFFTGWALKGRGAAVFDADGRQLVRYSVDSTPAGVQDALLSDLDSDGKLEFYVGFGDGEGIHRVDLNGVRVWANRQIGSILSLTAVDSQSGRHLLITSTDGSLTPIDADGNMGQPFSIGARAIHHLLAGPVRAEQPPWYCGLTYNVHGNLFVIGLDDQLREVWNYLLPDGGMDSQVKIGQPCQVVPGLDWQWLIAGPDGSVHVVSPDGQFSDSFNTGAPVHGLSGFRFDDTHVLAIASDRTVRAFLVTQR